MPENNENENENGKSEYLFDRLYASFYIQNQLNKIFACSSFTETHKKNSLAQIVYRKTTDGAWRRAPNQKESDSSKSICCSR